MADGNRKDPRARVLNMTVRYKSATVDEFIENHSHDISRGGIFIKTRSPFPAGTLLKFEVRIAEDQKVMNGVGRVVWRREAERADESSPAGMGIKFIKIGEGAPELISQMVAARQGAESNFDAGVRQSGEPPVEGSPPPAPALAQPAEEAPALQVESGPLSLVPGEAETRVSSPPKKRPDQAPDKRKVVLQGPALDGTASDRKGRASTPSAEAKPAPGSPDDRAPKRPSDPGRANLAEETTAPGARAAARAKSRPAPAPAPAKTSSPGLYVLLGILVVIGLVVLIFKPGTPNVPEEPAPPIRAEVPPPPPAPPAPVPPVPAPTAEVAPAETAPGAAAPPAVTPPAAAVPPVVTPPAAAAPPVVTPPAAVTPVPAPPVAAPPAAAAPARPAAPAATRPRAAAPSAPKAAPPPAPAPKAPPAKTDALPRLSIPGAVVTDAPESDEAAPPPPDPAPPKAAAPKKPASPEKPPAKPAPAPPAATAPAAPKPAQPAPAPSGDDNPY